MVNHSRSYAHSKWTEHIRHIGSILVEGQGWHVRVKQQTGNDCQTRNGEHKSWIVVVDHVLSQETLDKCSEIQQTHVIVYEVKYRGGQNTVCWTFTFGGFPRIRRLRVVGVRIRGLSWRVPWRTRNAARTRPINGRTYTTMILGCADTEVFGHCKGSHLAKDPGLFPTIWSMHEQEAS